MAAINQQSKKEKLIHAIISTIAPLPDRVSTMLICVGGNVTVSLGGLDKDKFTNFDFYFNDVWPEDKCDKFIGDKLGRLREAVSDLIAMYEQRKAM